MKSVAVVIILFINFMLINAIFADDTKNKANNISYSFINRGGYGKWAVGLVTNPTRHVRFMNEDRCKTNTLSSTDTLDCLFKKLNALIREDEYKYLLEYDDGHVVIYGWEVWQKAWRMYSPSELLIIFDNVGEYNKFINVLNNQYVLLTVMRKRFIKHMELTLQVVKQNGDDTVYKLIKAKVVR